MNIARKARNTQLMSSSRKNRRFEKIKLETSAKRGGKVDKYVYKKEYTLSKEQLERIKEKLSELIEESRHENKYSRVLTTLEKKIITIQRDGKFDYIEANPSQENYWKYILEGAASIYNIRQNSEMRFYGDVSKYDEDADTKAIGDVWIKVGQCINDAKSAFEKIVLGDKTYIIKK